MFIAKLSVLSAAIFLIWLNPNIHILEAIIVECYLNNNQTYIMLTICTGFKYYFLIIILKIVLTGFTYHFIWKISTNIVLDYLKSIEIKWHIHVKHFIQDILPVTWSQGYTIILSSFNCILTIIVQLIIN